MNEKLINLISKAINAYLNLDPESERRLKKLKDKVVTIELKPFLFIFQCKFHETGMHIHQHEVLPAQTRITGTPLQLMGVAMIKSNRQRFFAEDVIMEGDAELGHEVIALFDELHIDWEEYLSHLIGDIPAHHAGSTIRGLQSWIQQAAASFTDNVNEYVHEERNWLPSRDALEDFFNDIDVLRMDVDRTEAKVRQLQHLINQDEESL